MPIAGYALMIAALCAAWFGRRNPTALALFASWLISFVVWLRYGYELKPDEMIKCDLAVIAIIMAKKETCDLRPYHGFKHWLKCRLLERSIWDRAVMLLFLPAWAVYTMPAPWQLRWWLLWLIAMLQFVAVAGDWIEKKRACRMANASAPPPEPPSAGLEYARPAWVRGYG